MANMSYCRFENTTSDLDDCLSVLQEALDEGVSLKDFHKSLSSEYERRALRRMIAICEEIVNTTEQMEELEEGVLVDDDA